MSGTKDSSLYADMLDMVDMLDMLANIKTGCLPSAHQYLVAHACHAWVCKVFLRELKMDVMIYKVYQKGK